MVGLLWDVNLFDGYELMVRALDRKVPLLLLVESGRALSAMEQFIALRARAVTISAHYFLLP